MSWANTRKRKLVQEVLEARTRLLGAEHPDTLISEANLRALDEIEGSP